uniref:hypothetical protein n=1 Tax=Cupriavidus gilardii TaxID=82541 RepID=UPI00247B022A|nr:hypothetical protein [Cupriavidus gilardii]WDE72666.1 hypothetical protein [Cupriavidus gilardii]
MSAHITKFIAANAEGYFTAQLDNGGVRIGLEGSACFDVPPTAHAAVERVGSLTADEIEAVHDEFMGKYFFA